MTVEIVSSPDFGQNGAIHHSGPAAARRSSFLINQKRGRTKKRILACVEGEILQMVSKFKFLFTIKEFDFLYEYRKGMKYKLNFS